MFPYAGEALENTHKIAERCNVEIVFGEQKVPEFKVPDGLTAYEYLTKLCMEGLKERYPVPTKEITDRLEYELNTIKNMGYVDYFLIVHDFIKYARDNDIPVGPGRGSAAGSIVSYCLHITSLDPIKYNLLFEIGLIDFVEFVAHELVELLFALDEVRNKLYAAVGVSAER